MSDTQSVDPNATPRKRDHKVPRQVLPVRDPSERAADHQEVALGFGLDAAQTEALRCLQCRDPKCSHSCPIHTDIRAFVAEVAKGDYEEAYRVIEQTNPFPGICGRVCQHELYCEKSCLLDKKFESVAIGSLERFVADYHRDHDTGEMPPLPQPNGLRVALVGSGPAALICANDLARKGYKVAVFEALHQLGGVLSYGIPNFRLPREIIAEEVERLRYFGVEFYTDYIIGKTITVDELFEQGYAALFIGTGAGLPHMMGIPGENLIGVYTANEFLTRLNLMHAYDATADTPVRFGQRTVVVGGGNSAMDAARWAKRMGSQSIVMFRRGRVEMRAREEEIEHAGEEGVEFQFLAVPVKLIGDENGVLKEMECIKMELGPPDESGRASPIPVPGSEYRVPVDTVVMAIGQSPNPTLQQATPKLMTKRGKIVVNDEGESSMLRVFAGGDVVRGGSTVILAMQDGRRAAEAIDKALRDEHPSNFAHHHNVTMPAVRFRIVEKIAISPEIVSFTVEAPAIASRWKPGQFVILRPTADSERIPLTLVAGNAEAGTIRLVVQAIGKTTKQLAALNVGDALADLLGPLGKAAHITKLGTVVCAGGGVGIAELLPVARAFKEAGNHVIAMCGARSTAQMILVEELQHAADEVLWGTDDGSYGFHGNVVQMMRDWKARTGIQPAAVHVIGPIPMMRYTADLTREWGVPTQASLNPIMVDGTGMCGGCRVTVGGKSLFACVDGPEFDAHAVDFDELVRRNRAYLDHERKAREAHQCLIGLGQ
ncbi:MAG: NADPH-dependent glutamate synthase [Acidobacteria bacterium]|nr:NADPH-dependent glutamate synthase [Acidobacteriota bacterium]